MSCISRERFHSKIEFLFPYETHFCQKMYMSPNGRRNKRCNAPPALLRRRTRNGMARWSKNRHKLRAHVELLLAKLDQVDSIPLLKLSSGKTCALHITANSLLFQRHSMAFNDIRRHSMAKDLIQS